MSPLTDRSRDLPDFIWLGSMAVLIAFAALYPGEAAHDLKVGLAIAIIRYAYDVFLYVRAPPEEASDPFINFGLFLYTLIGWIRKIPAPAHPGGQG